MIRSTVGAGLWLRACLLAGPALGCSWAPVQAADPGPALRVCMDPDNPPFSSQTAGSPGLYVEIGQHVAEALGRTFQPVWTLSYWGKRSVRTTLLDHQCDAYAGLPQTDDFMGPKVIMSHPIASMGYALVLPKGRTVATIADLDGLRVAVQFASPPQSLVAEHDAIHPVTVRETGEAMKDLADGTADVAFIWGPTAGWINKTDLADAYQVVPVHGRNMQWQATFGFPSSATTLRDQVDAALAGMADTIAALREKYGLPADSSPSVDLASIARPSDHARVQLIAETSDAPGAGAAATKESAPDVSAGHDLFNANCSHCHGPDAIQSERRINLRLLEHRYGDRMDDTFTYTVHHGRADKGMPNWSGVISDDDLDKIKAYLHSVQAS